MGWHGAGPGSNLSVSLVEFAVTLLHSKREAEPSPLVLEPVSVTVLGHCRGMGRVLLPRPMAEAPATPRPQLGSVFAAT